MVNQEQLKELLSYDSESGIFLWNNPSGNFKNKGDSAGWISERGYLRINLKGRLYMAHRLAWLYVYGVWPENYIDHINGKKLDNRISNLRECTQPENLQNRVGPQKDNKIGVLGVYKLKSGRFQSRVKTKGVTTNLGVYDTAEEAHKVYIEAKRKLHKFNTL